MSAIDVTSRLGELSPGEHLRIMRYRRQLSAGAMAKLFGVSVECYRGMEKDRIRVSDNYCLAEIQPLTVGEACLLLRRRANLAQSAVAAELRVSQWYVAKMERGLAPAGTLARFWADKISKQERITA